MSRKRRTQQGRTRWRRLIAGVTLLGAVAACDVLGAPSRVRAGELYVSGSARYDAYFGEVHARQVAAATWPEDRKRTRKPLVEALKLGGEADDATLAETTKERLSGGALRLEVQGTEARIVAASAARHDDPHDLIVGVEQTAQAEMARAKQLAELPSQVDALTKAGRALEAHLAEDFAGTGQKPFDVREELYVSYDALAAIAQAAKREQQVADQFVAELGRAVSTGTEAPAASTAPPTKEKPGKPAAPAKPPRSDEPAKPARPARQHVEHAEHVEPAPTPAKPPPPPPAAAKPAEEFNP